MEVATGRAHLPGKHVLLTIGTDCASGKMGVSLELTKAARDAGLSATMVPTGQTGMMVEGWGAAIDRIAADFLQGTVEWLTEEGEKRADWVIVEGQGSLDHFAYSSVTLALIHAARPEGMILVHQAGPRAAPRVRAVREACRAPAPRTSTSERTRRSPRSSSRRRSSQSP